METTPMPRPMASEKKPSTSCQRQARVLQRADGDLGVDLRDRLVGDLRPGCSYAPTMNALPGCSSSRFLHSRQGMQNLERLASALAACPKKVCESLLHLQRRAAAPRNVVASNVCPAASEARMLVTSTYGGALVPLKSSASLQRRSLCTSKPYGLKPSARAPDSPLDLA